MPVELVKGLIEKHNKPTPSKYRKLGKSINLLGTMLQVAMGTLQGAGTVAMPGGYVLWVIGLAILQWLGTTITDFATEEPEEDVRQD